MLLDQFEENLKWSPHIAKFCTLMTNIYSFRKGYKDLSPFERFINEISIDKKMESKIEEYYNNHISLFSLDNRFEVSLEFFQTLINQTNFRFTESKENLVLRLENYFRNVILNKPVDNAEKPLILEADKYKNLEYLYNELVWLVAYQSNDETSYVNNTKILGYDFVQQKNEILHLLKEYIIHQRKINLLSDIVDKIQSGTLIFKKEKRNLEIENPSKSKSVPETEDNSQSSLPSTSKIKLKKINEISDKIKLLFHSRSIVYSRKEIRENFHSLYDTTSLDPHKVRVAINNKLNYLKSQYTFKE